MARLKDWLITAILVALFAAGSVSWQSLTPENLFSFASVIATLLLPIGLCALVWRSANQPYIRRIAAFTTILFAATNVAMLFGAGYAAAIIGIIELTFAILLFSLHAFAARSNKSTSTAKIEHT
jgi:hypothetical protein